MILMILVYVLVVNLGGVMVDGKENFQQFVVIYLGGVINNFNGFCMVCVVIIYFGIVGCGFSVVVVVGLYIFNILYFFKYGFQFLKIVFGKNGFFGVFCCCRDWVNVYYWVGNNFGKRIDEKVIYGDC